MLWLGSAGVGSSEGKSALGSCSSELGSGSMGRALCWAQYVGTETEASVESVAFHLSDILPPWLSARPWGRSCAEHSCRLLSTATNRITRSRGGRVTEGVSHG